MNFKLLLVISLLNISILQCSDNTIANDTLKTNSQGTAAEIPEKEELELLDQIESEVFYCAGECLESNIITRHDIFKRGFDGGKYTLNDLEDETLADQFSKVLKANITNEDINRNLKKNGLDDKEILNIANNWGFDGKDDFFEYLKKIYRANSATGFEIESHLVATQDEISDYYNQNIADYIIEKSYIIQTAFVPFTQEDKEKKFQELNSYCQNNIKQPEYISWEEPFEVKESEITASNNFLTTLDVGQTYIKEFNDGFTLYKMKAINQQRNIALADVREQIVVKLKKVKYASVINKVKEKFRCNSIIIRAPEIYAVPTEFDDLKN